MAQGKPQQKFEWIHAITSEIIDATDGRTTDEFRFHELCWHKVELKIGNSKFIEKIKTVFLCADHRNEYSGEAWNNSKPIWRTNTALKRLFPFKQNEKKRLNLQDFKNSKTVRLWGQLAQKFRSSLKISGAVCRSRVFIPVLTKPEKYPGKRDF